MQNRIFHDRFVHQVLPQRARQVEPVIRRRCRKFASNMQHLCHSCCVWVPSIYLDSYWAFAPPWVLLLVNPTPEVDPRTWKTWDSARAHHVLI